MPWPRHLLQSVEIPAVTQTRVSDDYTPGNSQWEIGDTTILATALGLASFKDVSHSYKKLYFGSRSLWLSIPLYYMYVIVTV